MVKGGPERKLEGSKRGDSKGDLEGITSEVKSGGQIAKSDQLTMTKNGGSEYEAESMSEAGERGSVGSCDSGGEEGGEILEGSGRWGLLAEQNQVHHLV